MQHLKFIPKLHAILNQPELQKWIFWSKTDNSVFTIKPYDPNFVSKVLKRYFRHGNVSSFVRQLHMYGFHKISPDHNNENIATAKKSDTEWSFTHPSCYFHKGAYLVTLRNIRRKKTGLDKDGKRKNVLLRVPVSFLNPSKNLYDNNDNNDNKDNNINNNGDETHRNQSHSNSMPRTLPHLNNVLMNARPVVDLSQSTMYNPNIILGIPSMNSYVNVRENSAHFYHPESMFHHRQSENRYIVANQDPNKAYDNRMIDFRGQLKSGYPMVPGTMSPYASHVEDQKNYQQYYNPNIFKSETQFPHLAQQPFVNVENSSQLPHNNVVPNRTSVDNFKGLKKCNSIADFHERESVANLLSKKRKSISILDSNRTKDEELSTKSAYASYEPSNPNSLLHSSNVIIGNSPSPPIRKSYDIDEYKTFQEACDAQFRYIDTDMESLIKSMLDIKGLVESLMTEKDYLTEKVATTKENIKDENASRETEKLELTDTLNEASVNKLDRLNSLLKDMTKVMGEYRDITKL